MSALDTSRADAINTACGEISAALFRDAKRTAEYRDWCKDSPESPLHDTVRLVEKNIERLLHSIATLEVLSHPVCSYEERLEFWRGVVARVKPCWPASA